MDLSLALLLLSKDMSRQTRIEKLLYLLNTWSFFPAHGFPALKELKRKHFVPRPICALDWLPFFVDSLNNPCLRAYVSVCIFFIYWSVTAVNIYFESQITSVVLECYPKISEKYKLYKNQFDPYMTNRWDQIQQIPL